MTTEDRIREVLQTIPDPEMPISIVDLGLIESVEIADDCVHIAVLPTFVGCPALDMIRSDIVDKVSRVDGVGDVEVRIIYDPPWSVDRISAAGRESLRAHGVTVPERGSFHDASPATVSLQTSALECPFCGSQNTRLDSAFGPTRCRMIYYCDGCRNTFEHMKRV